VLGDRGPKRGRISWLKNLRTWFSKTTTELFRATVDKVIISSKIANIPKEWELEEEKGSSYSRKKTNRHFNVYKTWFNKGGYH
jgi:hypothetical protein